MAFRIKPVSRKSGPQFKVQFEWFENGKRKTREINKAEWSRHGFTLSMTLEEANARKLTLNQQEHLNQTEKKRQTIKQRLDNEALTQEAYLPPADLAEFEADKLGNVKDSKIRSYWNCARRVMCEVALPISDWAAKSERFYKAFLKRKMSPAYVQKVLPLINRWGKFQAHKYKQFFDPIPAPRHDWANSISEDHYNKVKSRGNKESAPLTSEMLKKVEGKMKPEQALWLWFSLWFGLRPVEVDSLQKPSSKRTWWVSQEQDTDVLCIYQTKLKGLHPDQRVKKIPCVVPEQRELLKKIGQPMQRPLSKTMNGYFGGAVTLYGGRKAFTKLMKSYKQAFENVSSWLGHQDIQRTYADYYDRQEVTFTKVA
jgi:hypothetical protein